MGTRAPEAIVRGDVSREVGLEPSSGGVFGRLSWLVINMHSHEALRREERRASRLLCPSSPTLGWQCSFARAWGTEEGN